MAAAAATAATAIDLAPLLIDSKKEMQNPQSKNGVTYALIGSSGAGKSTLLREVFFNRIYGIDEEYIITLFTESPASNALKNIPPKVLVDPNGFDEDLFNLQYKFNRTYDKRYSFVNVLDDCIHLRYNKQLEKMFLIMRNTNLTSIVSLQFPRLIPLSIRTSVYFIFCMHLNTMEGIEIMVREFLSAYIPGHKISQKIAYYEAQTRDFSFFLIDNLNHKVYHCDKKYQCTELPRMAGQEDQPLNPNPNPLSPGGGSSKKEPRPSPHTDSLFTPTRQDENEDEK